MSDPAALELHAVRFRDGHVVTVDAVGRHYPALSGEFAAVKDAVLASGAKLHFGHAGQLLTHAAWEVGKADWIKE